MLKILEDWIRSTLTERQQHLNLNEPCLYRGGNSTVHKGVLAQFLGTDIPSTNNCIHLAHACNDGRCSNPRHLYWATVIENAHDRRVVNGYKNCRPPNHKGRKWIVDIDTGKRKWLDA